MRGDIRGKCFIEYIPAEYAWVPVNAENYMHINCFWVSGSCKGNGYANELLECCIVSFLSDPQYLAYKGFQIADTAKPCFTLMYLSFDGNAEIPQFKACAKEPNIEKDGFTLYYTNDCPYTAKYVPVVEQCAVSRGIPFTSVHIDSLKKAQNAPAAWINYALFYNGDYITNEILSEKKFITISEKLLDVEPNR